MAGKILISTAYLPPVEYFNLISEADEISIEKEENYLKQSYRNRCYILSAHGLQLLSVPVFEGSYHKVPVKEVRIDYSKRWQQVHIGAITAAYRSSPYFEFYFDNIEKIIRKDYRYLLDLNNDLTEAILHMLKINKILSYTASFEPLKDTDYDFRYNINPKLVSGYEPKRYLQVFDTGKEFVPNLSIIDLIFNTGPEAGNYL